jgi:hypothetical protein
MQPIRPNVGKLVGAGCQLIFGAFFSIIAFVIFVFSWSVGAPWYFIVFTLPFLIFGLGMVGFGLWSVVVKPMMVGVAFGPPSASLSSSQVRLGESISIQYEQAALRTLEVRRVLIQLVLREHATYRRGTDRRTTIRDNVIVQHESAGRTLERGGVLSEQCALQVPIDSMHSLQAPHNKLIWLVKFQVDVPNSPDVTEEVVFTVVPDVYAGAR